MGAIDPYVLAAFLCGRFGQYQIDRLSRGTAQGGLILKDVFNLLVPHLDKENQLAIREMLSSAVLSNREAASFYVQARRRQEAELGLIDLSLRKPRGYRASFSELETSRRFDPEHYYPAFKTFTECLPASIALEPLSQHLTFCQRGKQPIYACTGLPVINSKHVQPNRVLLGDNRSAVPNPDPDFQIRQGDTLLNGTGRGTLGRAAPYLSDGLAVPDNHVTILRSPDLDPVYLSLYLNSAAGQMQVEMHQRGTSGQLELYPFDIRKFLIWPAPESFQKELRDLHETAAAAERESKRLLEQAKTRVEQLIEGAAGG
jgi:type I restriction enzyme M protein